MIRFVLLRDVKSALVGLFVVFGGIGLSALTLIAHERGEVELAGLAALLSLLFVLLILIFVVPPLARNANAEVAQMNLPVDLTAGGFLFVGLIVVLAFAAWNTANNLLFLLLALLVSAFVIGAVLGAMSVRGLDVRLRLPEFIFAGEETPISVSVANRKRVFPTYSVLVELRVSDGRESALETILTEILPSRWAKRFGKPSVIKHTIDHVLTIDRRSESNHRAVYVFPRRGRFVIRDFELSTSFPFGILRHRRRLRAKEAEVAIYPEIKVSPNAVSGFGGADAPAASERELNGELRSIREYDSSDDVRSIEWKATAKTGRLMVRETAESTAMSVTVHVDERVASPYVMNDPKVLRRRLDMEREGVLLPQQIAFEKLISKVAERIVELSESGRPSRLVTSIQQTGFGHGRRHLHECLLILSGISPIFVDGGEHRIPAEIETSEEEGIVRFSLSGIATE